MTNYAPRMQPYPKNLKILLHIRVRTQNQPYYLYASLKLRCFSFLSRTFYTPLYRKYFYENRETSPNFTLFLLFYAGRFVRRKNFVVTPA